MQGNVMWYTRRLTRMGVIRYCVIDTAGQEPYGLAVAGGGQFAAVQHVSADAARVRGWCRRLARGRVRPCHLQELLCQWICE